MYAVPSVAHGGDTYSVFSDRAAPVPHEVVEALEFAREACAGWPEADATTGAPETVSRDPAVFACAVVAQPDTVKDFLVWQGGAIGFAAGIAAAIIGVVVILLARDIHRRVLSLFRSGWRP